MIQLYPIEYDIVPMKKIEVVKLNDLVKPLWFVGIKNNFFVIKAKKHEIPPEYLWDEYKN